MRLLEAIIDANHRALGGAARTGALPAEYESSLPLVVLTCIDPRLNALLPKSLGLPEEQFIWLRNAGNIITGPLSSTMRSLALAGAIKGGREIAIIGHTDCKVRQSTALQLTEQFRRLGVERSRLPDNLNEFFGLFASESQNVLRAADFVRQSPLIGPSMPVHGLLLDVQTGKLEWLVNGYQSLETAKATTPAINKANSSDFGNLTEFNIGEMKFPETQIGAVSTITAPVVTPSPAPAVESRSEPLPSEPVRPQLFKLDPLAMFKVVGDDQKIYGPVTGSELEEWLREGRITLQTLAQKLGYKEWKQLATFGHSSQPPPVPPSSDKSQSIQKRLRQPWLGKLRR